MLRLLRQRSLRVALIAAFALLIAQIGAVRHVYAHGGEGSVASLKQQLPGTQEACSDCLNYTPLLAAAAPADTAGSDVPPPRPHRTACASVETPGSGPPLAFRSRAPPAAP